MSRNVVREDDRERIDGRGLELGVIGDSIGEAGGLPVKSNRMDDARLRWANSLHP